MSSNLVFVGQWVALTTGALAILLVLSQLLRACMREVHRRSRLSEVVPDDKLGADGFPLKFSSSAASAKRGAEKKEVLLDRPQLEVSHTQISDALEHGLQIPKDTFESPHASHKRYGRSETRLDNRPARERTPSPGCLDERPPPEWSAQREPRAAEPYSPTQSDTENTWEEDAGYHRQHTRHSTSASTYSTSSFIETPPPKISARRKAEEEAAAQAAEEEANRKAAEEAAAQAADEAKRKAEKEAASKPGEEAKRKVVKEVAAPPDALAKEVLKQETWLSPAAQSPSAAASRPRKADTHNLRALLGGITFSATFTVEDQALGFELRFAGGCPIVTKVVDRSPASEKGVSVQNRALAVNGVPLRGPWPLRKMSKQQWLASVFSSRPLTITFEQTPVKALE